MKLNQLPKIMARSSKRLGRGLGSGKGKTAARGAKGQKKRGTVSVDFSGGGLPLYKRIPYLRGSKNRQVSAKPVLIRLDQLSKYKNGEVVNFESLVKYGVVADKAMKKSGVKILSQGDIKLSLQINVPISKGALAKIEKAGGSLV